MTLDSFSVTLPERKVFGTYAAKLEDLRLALEWMRRGKVDAKSWTTRLPLAQAEQAFRRALAAKGNDIKMIVAP
jgi:threonine dehydrogenase-like Zn-dependent dehydrogenase